MPLARFNFQGCGGEGEGKGRERVVTRESVHCHRSVRGYGIVYLVYSRPLVFDNLLEVKSWRVLSRRPVNQREEKLLANNSLQRRPGRAHRPPAVSRSRIVIDLVPLLFEKSEDTKSRRNC